MAFSKAVSSFSVQNVSDKCLHPHEITDRIVIGTVTNKEKRLLAKKFREFCIQRIVRLEFCVTGQPHLTLGKPTFLRECSQVKPHLINVIEKRFAHFSVVYYGSVLSPCQFYDRICYKNISWKLEIDG
jgi:hypothetical protein